jgi:hypothetical protein
VSPNRTRRIKLTRDQTRSTVRLPDTLAASCLLSCCISRTHGRFGGACKKKVKRVIKVGNRGRKSLLQREGKRKRARVHAAPALRDRSTLSPTQPHHQQLYFPPPNPPTQHRLGKRGRRTGPAHPHPGPKKQVSKLLNIFIISCANKGKARRPLRL